MKGERPTGIHESAVVGSPPEHREWCVGDNYYLPVIHPSARVNAFVTIDSGLKSPTYVGPRAFIMAHSHLGHDCRVGADCELAPGTIIGGHVVLGDGVRCGIGALVKPFVKVGKGARIGMGAVVIRDVAPGDVVVGNPARPLR